jgi:hypothetical protein
MKELHDVNGDERARHAGLSDIEDRGAGDLAEKSGREREISCRVEANERGMETRPRLLERK